MLLNLAADLAIGIGLAVQVDIHLSSQQHVCLFGRQCHFAGDRRF